MNVLKNRPALADGEWHEVLVPLKDLTGSAPAFDPKKAWQFDLGTGGQGDLKFTLYVDDIGFTDRPAPAAAGK